MMAQVIVLVMRLMELMEMMMRKMLIQMVTEIMGMKENQKPRIVKADYFNPSRVC